MVADSLNSPDVEIDPVTEKCRGALDPGGKLVGIHAVLTHERPRPAVMALGLLPETPIGRGAPPDQGFLTTAMGRCGFEKVTFTEDQVELLTNFFVHLEKMADKHR